MAQDLSQETQITVEMISEDRRSLRFKRTFELKEFDFDEEITLRLFRSDDVIQVTMSDDLDEFFATMICCELPLSLNNKTTWFAQVKTKQVRIDLQLEQDESLIPEEEVKADGIKKAGTVSSPADAGVSQLSTQKKDQLEF